MPTNRHTKYVVALLVLSGVFFFLGNNTLGLTNPDEVFYAQTAKEMVARDSWMTPYMFGAPQFEKPILLYWLLRVSTLLFGVSGFAWRFFPALFAAAGVICTYYLASFAFGDRTKGFLSAIILMSSGFYVGLAKTVYTDMVFSVFILLAMACFFLGYVNASRRGVGFFLFFVFAALAVLAKGPLGLLLPLLTVVLFLAVRRELRVFVRWSSLAGLVAFVLLAVPWYAFVIDRFGRAFTSEFFYNDHVRRLLEAEHPQNDTWYFYPVSCLACMFPWTIFVFVSLVGLVARLVRRTAAPVHVFLACWIVVTLAVFQSAHSKLVSYVFPLFPALALLAGDFLGGSTEERTRAGAGVASAFVFTALLVGFGLAFAIPRYPEYMPPVPWVYVMAAACGVLASAVVLLAVRRRFMLSAYATAPLLVVLFFFDVSSPGVEARLSSRSACQYVPRHSDSDSRVLCSKYFARGVYYYTGREVAVISVGGSNFFSPHPIPFLDTDEKVRQFLGSQAETYCVVDEHSMEDLRRLAAGDMRLEAVGQSGNEFVVRITRNQPRSIQARPPRPAMQEGPAHDRPL